MIGGRAAEGDDLRAARSLEMRLDDRHNKSDVETITDSICDVHRVHSHVEIDLEIERHHIVFESRHAVLGAVATECCVASGEIHVLVSEREIDVLHVDAAQRREPEPAAIDPGENSPLPERLWTLREYRSR